MNIINLHAGIAEVRLKCLALILLLSSSVLKHILLHLS